MANQYKGCCVSIDCNDGSVVQGEVNGMTDDNETLILKRAFKNGIPCTNPEIYIKNTTIKNLKIIKVQIENEQDLSNQISCDDKKSVSMLKQNSKQKNKSKNVSNSVVEQQPQNFNHKERNDACFGVSLDNILKEDFDFEKNLALFNKKAFYNKIHKKPDLVPHEKVSNNKYKHNENVLHSTPVKFRQVTVPSPAVNEYITDDGLVVPSITSELRWKLFNLVEENGLTSGRQNEIIGRAATEMVLQLLGGSHRFNPRNEHQWPRVVVLCGPNRSGAMGVNCARQLSSYGVHTVVVLSEPGLYTPQLANEMSLYQFTTGRLITSAAELHGLLDPDFVVVSLADEQTDTVSHNIANWAKSVRAPLMAIDPPSDGTPLVAVKYSLVPALPLSYSESNGKIYLCNMAIPTQVFHFAGIQYKSPFGSKSVIPLHIN
ncbi:enhancer of mRNA-decapping protein 3 [Adelges cooleyi]|uniref:enhancer of mRNA-decapping protein 3 n=1 Tax=Adelges cooleyi TaxID=133065 RepID=UPI00217F4B85|nr:enhancer of mRNA-decapping protein 3 [Adelges cooleyi]XP_050440419.1 enhancer of mRNA-decapping protein 3 [Adelges cooleyi]XP_050440420.1 enhancer of mRNA-decapping protein 3 [Adelges cooleyi]